MNRAAFLAAVGQAASAAASGTAEPGAAAALAGRRFSIRLPFGCNGPSANKPGYAVDAKAETLRITAKPQQWADDRAISALLGASDAEAIEGFWISRPWITNANCPSFPNASVEDTYSADEASHPAGQSPKVGSPPASRSAAGRQPPASSPSRESTSPAPPVPPEPETVGLASVFAKDGSRLLRRGARAYEVVRKGMPAEGGFRLVLEGRFTPADGAGAVRCATKDANQRPICVARVEFDRVAIEAAGGEVLGEWRN